MAGDVYLFNVINSFAGRFGGLDALGVFGAVFLLPLLGFLLLPAAFTIKRIKEAHWYEMPLHALLAALLAYTARSGLGALVGRARPFVTLADVPPLIPMDHLYDSFPSGHAALSFALAYIVWKHDRDWGIAFFVLALIVAVSRVFVGVHYPVDVVSGAIIGLLAGWIVQRFEKGEWRKIERALKVR